MIARLFIFIAIALAVSAGGTGCTVIDAAAICAANPRNCN